MCNIPGHGYGCCCSGNGNIYVQPPSCGPCSNNGPCPIKLDTQCIIYHKDNNTLTGLIGLGLGNGATLKLILDTIDTYIQQLQVSDWNIPCLRAIPFTINTVQAFANAVDTTLCSLQTQIDTIADDAAIPIVATDSNSIDFTTSGTLGHDITASVKISATSGNRTSILSDGLFTDPQTLSINYSDGTLSIAGGNTVDFSSLLCTDNFLGNVTSDPSGAVDGNLWFRTDLSASVGLKIKVNGLVRTIATS